MLLLAGVLFSTEKYKAMKQKNSCPILDHASCHSQEEWHLDSTMLRSMSRITRPAYMSAMGSMLFMLKRQVICVTVFFIQIWIFMSYNDLPFYNQVPFARSSLNHDDIFILDTKFKIFQFSGSNSSIQERAKALEVVQYIKDTFHEGKCEIASVGEHLFTLCGIGN